MQLTKQIYSDAEDEWCLSGEPWERMLSRIASSLRLNVGLNRHKTRRQIQILEYVQKEDAAYNCSVLGKKNTILKYRSY